jgi:folate-binding protein YgfZ
MSEPGDRPIWVDCSGWGIVRVTGGDRVRFLQGLTTVNVEALAPGAHAWGAILSPKGRVLSLVEVVRHDDHLLVECEPALLDKTAALLDRYAVMDDVVFERVATPAHRRWSDAASVWTAPLVLAPAPGPVADPATVEVLRVEAGLPRYGVDVDEDHFPFETPLARVLDYGKGCYIGQEPVFRVHAQGKSARMLRGLRLDGEGTVTSGTVVAHPAKAEAGKVTSSVISPRLGPIALAYLHRSTWEPGGEVTVDGRRATVHELPFA